MAYERFVKLDGIKHGRMIKATIGMGRAKFDKLAAAYDAFQRERLERGEIRQAPSGGPKGHLDTFEKTLFFVLYYLKTYPVFDVPGFHSGLSSGHAHGHVKPALAGALPDPGVLPARSPGTPEEFAPLVERHGGIALDGLECPCARPQGGAPRQARHGGKKNATRSQRSPSRPCGGKSFSPSATR